MMNVIILFSLLYFIQLMLIILGLEEMSIKTKKQFWICCIPIVLIIYCLYKTLIEFVVIMKEIIQYDINIYKKLK